MTEATLTTAAGLLGVASLLFAVGWLGLRCRSRRAARVGLLAVLPVVVTMAARTSGVTLSGQSEWLPELVAETCLYAGLLLAVLVDRSPPAGEPT